MVQRFGESELLHLTDPTGTGEVDQALLALALADATGEVDSYLAAVLTEALTTIPVMLITVTCDIARYRLYALAGGQPEQVKERYDAAIKWLLNIAAGRARLSLPVTDGTVTTAGSSGIAAGTRTLIFDSLTEESYLRILV